MSAVNQQNEVLSKVRGEAKPRHRMPLRLKILTFLGSTIVTLLVGEIAVRLFMPAHVAEAVTDDELLWKNRPNQVVPLGVTGEGNKPRQITTDEFGFRRTLPALSGRRRRVLALGDSAMFGSLLDDEETFCSRLQALAGGKLDITNTAVGGWGLFQCELLLRQKIESMRPEIVIVHFQSCDVPRQPFPPEQPRRKAMFLLESRIVYTVRHYSKLATLLAKLAQIAILRRSGRGIVNQVVDNDSNGTGEQPSAVFRRCWAQDRERLIAMASLAKVHGAKFVIVAGAPADCVAGVYSSSPKIRYFFDEIEALAKERGMIYVNLTPAMQSYDIMALTLLPRDGHPSPLWNRLVAEEIARTLEAAGLLKFN